METTIDSDLKSKSFLLALNHHAKNERESNLAIWHSRILNGQISLKTISLTTKICSQCLTIEGDERVDCCPKGESIVAKGP